MLITTKTAITFRLPKEKALMEEFETKNPDWVIEDMTTIGATFKRTYMVDIGSDITHVENNIPVNDLVYRPFYEWRYEWR